MENIRQIFEDVKREVSQVVIGQAALLEGIVLGLMVGGHVLLEGPPGVAKTLIAKAIARSMSADFKRIQFTPDLMPLDLIGTSIFDLQKQVFVFKEGPIFTDILLADEINRTPPKTQSALLEAMEEKQVTIDGFPHRLSTIFTVLATQNPLEYEGTYPLPEAQLDRFLLKLRVSYPEIPDQVSILKRFENGMVGASDLEKIQPVLSPERLLTLRAAIHQVRIREELLQYIAQIIQATREHPLLLLGASPRAGLHLLLVSKAYAASQGRDYVIPEDIQEICPSVLRHRLILKPEAMVDGRTSDQVIANIVVELKVPR